MNTISKTAAALLATALITAGPASAYSVVDINSSADTAGVMFSVDGTVATLRGQVDGQIEKDALERNAAQLEGIDEVRNFLSVSS